MMTIVELAKACREFAFTIVRGLEIKGDTRAARDALAYELSATIDDFVRAGMRPENPYND